MNTVKSDHFGTSLKLSANSADKLRRYEPKGCPFRDYTLLDLLFDWCKMYSWMFYGEITVKEFIGMVKSKDIKAEVYGDNICKLIEEV